MILFFNHGLSAPELFVNTPKKYCDRSLYWFRKNIRYSATIEEAMSDPFKYCLGIILHAVIDEKKRFKIPRVPESYIDFEIVTGEKFEKHRYDGRFQEIDFIASDFTGYALRYYFKAKAYQKSQRIYIGGSLKEKFLNGINSGVKYYTTEDFTIDDFLPDVYKKFNQLTEREVKELVLLGFRRMHSSIRYGCSISIRTHKYVDCTAFIGPITLDPEKHLKGYDFKRKRKLRKMEEWRKAPFDGYYYIGLDKSVMNEWIENNRLSKTIFKFNNVMIRRIKEEFFHKSNHIYIFRYKVKKFKGWTFWKEYLKARNVEYLGVSIDRKFNPTDLSLKEFIKQYEKRSS